MSSGASPISGEVRAGVELASSVFWAPLLAIAPKGDGHPVLVIPGLAQGELALQPLMHFLTHSQYNARSWQQGLMWVFGMPCCVVLSLTSTSSLENPAARSAS